MVGKVKTVKRLRSGDLLIEVSTFQQEQNLLKTKQILDQTVKAEPHRSLNLSKAMIRCLSLDSMSDDEIKNELTDQGVTHVRRLGKSPAYVLTFNRPYRPSDIRIGYELVRCTDFIPAPLRCYRCQKLGHGTKTCRSAAVCSNCGNTGHELASCDSPSKCVNCCGDHASDSRDCSAWNLEKQALKLRSERQVTLPQARRIVRESTLTPSHTSFSAVVASNAPVQTVSNVSEATSLVSQMTGLVSALATVVKTLQTVAEALVSRAPAVTPSIPSSAPAITPAVVACVDAVKTDHVSNNVTMHVPAERSASHENRDKIAVKQAPVKPPTVKTTAPVNRINFTAPSSQSHHKDIRHLIGKSRQNSVTPNHPAYQGKTKK